MVNVSVERSLSALHEARAQESRKTINSNNREYESSKNTLQYF